jgi:hypothetical protein
MAVTEVSLPSLVHHRHKRNGDMYSRRKETNQMWEMLRAGKHASTFKALPLAGTREERQRGT